jgi:hypothetical protein
MECRKRSRPRKYLYSSTDTEDDVEPSYKSILIPFQLSADSDFLTNFIDVVTAYCNSINKKFSPKLNYDSIMRYYGISGEALNLTQIGELHNVTRERVRQIREIHLNKIRKLINGFVINGLRCDCIIRQEFNYFRDRFFSYRVLTDSTMEKILLEERVLLSEERKPHLQLFLNVLHTNRVFLLARPLYFTRKVSNLNKFKRAYFKTKQYLEKIILPVSLKILEYDLAIPTEMLRLAIDANPSVEEVGIGEYQIKDSDLSSFDVAYRVLSKAGSMDMTELLDTVNKLRGKAVDRIMLTIDKRFKNIGKTNQWGLEGSDINADYIYQLIEKALKFYDHPSTIEEIYRHIQMVRPDITFDRVFGTTHIQCNKKFYQLEDGKIILKSWKSKYKDELKEKRRISKEGTFTSLLIQVLKGRVLYGNEIIKEIQARSKLSDSTCRNSLCHSKIIEKRKRGGKNLYTLKSDYETILSTTKNYRRKAVAEFIYDLFKREKKSKLRRKYIVEQILLHHKVSVPFIYEFLRKSSDIFNIERKSKKDSWVSLNSLLK